MFDEKKIVDALIAKFLSDETILVPVHYGNSDWTWYRVQFENKQIYSEIVQSLYQKFKENFDRLYDWLKLWIHQQITKTIQDNLSDEQISKYINDRFADMVQQKGDHLLKDVWIYIDRHLKENYRIMWEDELETSVRSMTRELVKEKVLEYKETNKKRLTKMIWEWIKIKIVVEQTTTSFTV